MGLGFRIYVGFLKGLLKGILTPWRVSASEKKQEGLLGFFGGGFWDFRGLGFLGLLGFSLGVVLGF